MFQNDGWSGNVRMLPTGGVTRKAMAGAPVSSTDKTSTNVRCYTAGANGTVDVLDVDASVVASQGFFAIGASGPTAARPINAYLRPGFLYLDTDLSLIISWNGVGWANPVTGAAA
jgi:hypothetical protein